VLDFWDFNAALLRDFDDDAASVASGMATDGGSVAGGDGLGVAPPVAAHTWMPFTLPPLDELTISATPGEEDLDLDIPEQRARETTPRGDASTNRAGSGRPNNPYAAAIEDKQNAMTVAFLRSPARTGPTDTSSSFAPDDLGYVLYQPLLRDRSPC
jgi:hypothetical protein